MERVAAACAGLCLVGAALLLGDEPAGKGPSTQPALVVRVKPGRVYTLTLSSDDAVAPGKKWRGDPPGETLATALSRSPLRRMCRKRFIIKGDDLAAWSLEAFQRFARVVEAHDAKAGFGIVPGQCDDKTFAWAKTLDPERFEIWNHTWMHGKNGPEHYHQPYDAQCHNLELAHNKVLAETGITMHTWCGGGIKYQGRGVHDQDEVTHWVVRNHPDYKVHFHADPRLADHGLGQINSDGIFIPWQHSWFENEWLNEKEDASFVRQLKKRWPDVDWKRPSALGNAEEMKWRLDHPFWNVPESGRIEVTVAQFHPGSWDDEKLKALGELLEYVKGKGDWRFANAYETYQWLRDKDDILLEKTAPREYRLDVKSVRFDHALELELPPDTQVSERVYQVTGQ